MTGGGAVPKPGMVTLAHRGVLFLDEMAEFKRQTLDVLRQPMEEGNDFLARSRGNFVYPADFYAVRSDEPLPLRLLSGQKPLQMSGLGGASVIWRDFRDRFSTGWIYAVRSNRRRFESCGKKEKLPI